jgi:hypothetical protein
VLDGVELMPPANPLGHIHTFPELVRYLEDELGWPLQEYGFDELTFEYTPAELGLKEEDAARIKAIHQLRPLAHGQPWGIFFVEFEHKKLPVVVLRRILSHLVIKKRESANKAAAPAWHAEDLLFVTAFGEAGTDAREIAFAHFHQNPGDLPTLHVLGWDGGDTPLKLAKLDQILRDKMQWPENEADADAWRETWRKPFRHKIGHVIRTADLLAEELARLARGIRDKAKRMLAAESEKGPLTQLYKAFKTALIHDLSDKDFADTYAQTITYGLLTAAISRTEKSEGRHGTALLADDIANIVPVTNPFLKEMLQTFLKVGGRKGGIDFDELGIQDVVELLRGDETDLPAILRDFGNKTRGEDPVIHFYEHFLNAYNKQLKIQRGVFYTPQPVVGYIVRSVHELLQTEFGLEGGLASTITWGEIATRNPDIKIPEGTDPGSHFVNILDPATGTATFLVEVINVIHRTLMEIWTKQGLNEAQRLDAWNEYVPKHLLPRLYGYELMMAPYAIAHMKIGLKLFETGYRFGSEERVRVYLTNALEPASDAKGTNIDLEALAPALAHEAQAVNDVKRRQRFTVVIGNPPYSKMSGNLGEHAVRLIEPFRFVDRDRIVEKGALALELNLQDDYVKFWALLRHKLMATDVGVGAYITNSRYLASPTLRGLRWNLKQLFDRASFLNLGGQVSERSDSAGLDENVFDIEQGVAIGVGVRTGTHTPMNSVFHGRCRGTRDEKYSVLNAASIGTVQVKVELDPPYFRFSHGVDEAEAQFTSWHGLAEIMPFNSGCIITSRDNLAIDFDRVELLAKVTRFAASPKGDSAIEKEIGYSCKAKWDVERCKASIRSDPHKGSQVRRVLYRPFDGRWIYYSSALLDTPSKPVCDSVFDQENLVMLTPKVNTSEIFSHVLVSRVPAEKKSCSHDRATQMFPLYRHDSGLLKDKQPNLAKAFSSDIRAVAGDAAKPEMVFAYIYGVLHSPEYRRRYGSALRDSYPRIPVVNDGGLFSALAHLGGELVALHLLESPKVNDFITRFEGQGNNGVPKKPTWKDGAVWINPSQRFEGVPEAVWNFHIGGYQVCEKWLKDRKGRTLSDEDIAHYQRVVVALNETIRLMAEIDRVIDAHGGWPGAFATPHVAGEEP